MINSMGKVSKMQYKNLRYYFQKLINNILGDNYYNMANDVYDCDEQCCEDIFNAFKYLKELLKYSRVLNFILLLIIVLQGFGVL